MKQITLRTPAKINLCLSVIAKRQDDYHEVEMVMQAVGLYDVVTVRLAESGIAVSCGAQGVPDGEANIAWRAARAMLDRTHGPTTPGLLIEIEKHIPVAAGLGGGSSDAAAVLVACNTLLGLALDRQELAGIGT